MGQGVSPMEQWEFAILSHGHPCSEGEDIFHRHICELLGDSVWWRPLAGVMRDDEWHRHHSGCNQCSRWRASLIAILTSCANP